MTRGASIILVLTIMVPAVVLGQAYKTMSLLEAEMADMAIAHPLNATLMTLEDGAGVAIETVGKDLVDPVNDIKRRHLHSLAISSGTGTQSKKIVVIGSQHAAEWAAYRTVLNTTKFILDKKTLGGGAAGWKELLGSDLE